MENKEKYIYIGLGALVLGGLVYYFTRSKHTANIEDVKDVIKGDQIVIKERPPPINLVPVQIDTSVLTKDVFKKVLDRLVTEYKNRALIGYQVTSQMQNLTKEVAQRMHNEFAIKFYALLDKSDTKGKLLPELLHFYLSTASSNHLPV